MLLIAGCLVKGAAAAVGGRVLRALLPLPHAADRAAPFGAGCASHSRQLSPRHSARGALASCSHWTPLATPTTTAVVVRVSVVAAVAAAAAMRVVAVAVAVAGVVARVSVVVAAGVVARGARTAIPQLFR